MGRVGNATHVEGWPWRVWSERPVCGQLSAGPLSKPSTPSAPSSAEVGAPSSVSGARDPVPPRSVLPRTTVAAGIRGVRGINEDQPASCA
jgi:hypothetical protein